MWVGMAVVSAFLVPAQSAPGFAAAFEMAADALVRSQPDVLLVFTTRWQSEGDLQWLTPSEHAPNGFQIDSELAQACIAGTRAIGIESSRVMAIAEIDPESLQLNKAGVPIVIAANNPGHDFNVTERIGGLAAAVAERLKRRVAVIGVGGLSMPTDAGEALSDDDDQWNQKILNLIVQGDIYALRCELKEFTAQARADNGFKHFGWVLGALGGVFTGATLHAYGACGAGGGAVLEFQL
jgi:2-aminophenol/2-amino-5-chlorophenol 1,6-dioxygenase alpha subunit